MQRRDSPLRAVKFLPSLPGIHENPEEESGGKHPLLSSKNGERENQHPPLSSPKGGDNWGAFNLQVLRKATTERAESPTLPLKRAWGTKKKVHQPDLKRARGRRKDEPPQLFKARKNITSCPTPPMKRSGKTIRILRGKSGKRGDKKGKKPLLIHPETASENTACILHIYRQTAEKDRISKKSKAKKLSESDKKTNRIAEERKKEKNKQLKGRKVNKTDVKLTASHIVANRSKQA